MSATRVRMMRGLGMAVSAMFLLAAGLGCGSDDRHRGGGASPGDACSADDASGDVHACSGTRTLECKEDAFGEYVWEVEDECAETGEVCVAGECAEAGSGNNSGSCPDLAGTWTFSDHCETSLIGETYQVTQDGCELTVDTPGWTGSVQPGGNVTLSGPADPGTIMTCTGQATTTRLAASCSPPCDVVLER